MQVVGAPAAWFQRGGVTSATLLLSIRAHIKLETAREEDRRSV
jgi:hypothetical protein